MNALHDVDVIQKALNPDAIFAAIVGNEFAFWAFIVVVGLIVYGLLSSVVLALFRSGQSLAEEEDQLRQRMNEEIRRHNLKEFRTRR